MRECLYSEGTVMCRGCPSITGRRESDAVYKRRDYKKKARRNLIRGLPRQGKGEKNPHKSCWAHLVFPFNQK